MTTQQAVDPRDNKYLDFRMPPCLGGKKEEPEVKAPYYYTDPKTGERKVRWLTIG